MSKADLRARSARIVAAVDASELGLAALEEAVGLAAELKAELQGVFVEEEDLLHLAGLPFATEVTLLSTGRRLDPLSMTRALRAEAERVRRTLEESARRRSVHWSFQVARGRLIREALAVAMEADLLLAGCERRLPRQAPATVGRRVSRRPILALYDGSESGHRVLEHAVRLAVQGQRAVYVLPGAESEEQAQLLGKEALARLRLAGVEADVHQTAVDDAPSLMRIARQAGGHMLLVNGDSRLADEAGLEEMVNHLDCPVALVR